MENLNGTVLVTALTNLAVQEIIKKILSEYKPGIEEILFLLLVTNEVLTQQIGEQKWKNCRVPEVLQAHADSKVKEAKSKFANQFLARRLLHDGNPYHEGEALHSAIEIRRPKLVLGTVPMIGMLMQVWEQSFEMKHLRHLVTDEGSLLPEMFLLAKIAALPDIERVLVTGDQYQLPPYTGTSPDNVICLGHEAVIEKLVNNPTIKYVFSSKNFRSHPALVEALSKASYGGQLVAGRTAEERMYGRCSDFRHPVIEFQFLCCRPQEESS